jgi:hypothetical protein
MSTKQSRGRVTIPAPVARWVSRPAGGDQAEDRLASMIRSADSPGGLGTVARARVWARLRRRPIARRPLRSLRWGVAIGLLLTSGVVLAAFSARRWLHAPAPIAPAAGPATPRAGYRQAARIVNDSRAAEAPVANDLPPAEAPVPEDVRPAPPVLPARATAAPHGLRARGRIAATADAAPRAADAASALSGETPLLGEALARLRQQHDARSALATLDQYRARYPEGVLRHEADRARVDALLLLGRNTEALAELSALSLRPVGRDQELQLIRGELSAVTDCARAAGDFDRILSAQAPTSLVERALQGRAACRLRLGDKAGARQDMSEYLRRFPEGRFAPEARRTLEARPPGL